jgi:integrase
LWRGPATTPSSRARCARAREDRGCVGARALERRVAPGPGPGGGGLSITRARVSSGWSGFDLARPLEHLLVGATRCSGSWPLAVPGRVGCINRFARETARSDEGTRLAFFHRPLHLRQINGRDPLAFMDPYGAPRIRPESFPYLYASGCRAAVRAQRPVGKTNVHGDFATHRVLRTPQGVDNPQRRRTEKRPFESWEEVEAVAAAVGSRYGPLVLFAAATGMRPG